MDSFAFVSVGFASIVAQLIAYYLREPPGSSTYRILPPRDSPGAEKKWDPSLGSHVGSLKFVTGNTERFLSLCFRMNKLAFTIFVNENRPQPAPESASFISQG